MKLLHNGHYFTVNALHCRIIATLWTNCPPAKFQDWQVTIRDLMLAGF